MKKVDIKLKKKYLSSNNTTAYLEFSLKEDFDFIPGQFWMLDNWQIKRPYSFASSPFLVRKDKKIYFYVKKVSESWMSKYLVEDIKEGENLSLMWPFWHMNLEPADNYLFVSIGSGLAPMISMMEHLFLENFSGKVYNIFGERFYDNIPLKVLEKLDSFPLNFKNYITLSKQEDFYFKNEYKNINFSKWHVQDVLKEIVDKLKFNEFRIYLCWKPSMVDEIVDFLVKNWAQKQLIKFEKY